MRVEREANEQREYTDYFRIVLDDGTVKHINDIGHPVFNAEGSLVEFVGTTVDVTERKRAEEALRRTQMEVAHANRVATMGQLTASIAHEMNQPIAATVINAHAALRWLSAQRPDLEEVRQSLTRIVENGSRAGEVIRRIRALIRNAPPRKDWVAINGAILGGSSRPPSRMGPIDLIAIVARPTNTTTSQVCVIAAIPARTRRSRR